MTRSKTRSAAYQKEWRLRNPEKTKEYHRRWLERHPERRKEVARNWRRRNNPKVNAYAFVARRKLKSAVVKIYGGACACCGESEQIFLTIDHTNGNGRAHRKEMGNNDNLYRLLIRNGKPLPDYRLMCWNCTCGHARNR